LVPPEEVVLTSRVATSERRRKGCCARDTDMTERRDAFDPRAWRPEEEEPMKQFELVIADGGPTAARSIKSYREAARKLVGGRTR
jgi:hypothetical protein